MTSPHYLDGFVFPIKKIQIEEYQKAAMQVAKIWKDHGAIDYLEFQSDGSHIEGTLSFDAMINANEDEQIIFGWTLFPSKEVRDKAHKLVAEDPRMTEIVGPLVDPERMIFDAGRMVYGGFNTLVGNKDN